MQGDASLPAPATTGTRRTAVLVLGMHRSGTSVLTRLVGQLGAALPRHRNPGGSDNPEGYWEPISLVGMHDRMLTAIDSAWLDIRPPDLGRLRDGDAEDFVADLRRGLAADFGDSPCFVLKDPRVCRLVPLYRWLLGEMGADVRIVLALRDPAAVAASLHERNQLSAAYSGLLWASHMLAAERDTRDLPRVVVDYDDLVADPPAAARRIAGLLAGAVPPVDRHAVAATVREDLRHHRADGPCPFGPALGPLLRDLHAALAAGAPPARFDEIRAGLARISARTADAILVEFRFQTLTSPHDTVVARNPAAARRDLVAALGRLHRRAIGNPPA